MNTQTTNTVQHAGLTVDEKAAHNAAALNSAKTRTAVVIRPDSLTGLSAAFKAETKVQATLAAAFDALYADGVRSEHLLKSGEQYQPEVCEQVTAAIQAGVFNKAENALLAMTAEQAKTNKVGDARTALTRILSKYMGNVRRSLDARDPVKVAEAAKAKEADKKAKGATGEHGEQDSASATETNAHAVGKVDPRASREAFCEAMNIMIAAAHTHTDKLISKNADRYAAAFTAILAELTA